MKHPAEAIEETLATLPEETRVRILGASRRTKQIRYAQCDRTGTEGSRHGGDYLAAGDDG